MQDKEDKQYINNPEYMNISELFEKYKDNSYILQSDEFYVDNTLVQSGDYVLSNLDNKVVLIASNARFSTVSTTTGDVVHVLAGIQNGEDFFIKNSDTSWSKIDFQEKFDIVES